MLSQARREALAEQLKQGVQNVSRVKEEEWAEYPAQVKELAVPTTQGDAKVFSISTEDTDASRPLVINFHGGGFIGKRMDRDELFCCKLVNRFGALVLDVDYKLAQAHCTTSQHSSVAVG